ncbi:MAG: D-aminoacyl-tRNA deacylase [Thiotrichaceae bacterium]
MIGLIQRVTSASVTVDKECVGKISNGILLLLGVEKGDNAEITKRLVNRVINYRIFEDATGRMNLSLLATKGELLVVPQFTLPADTKKGTRPSFTPAAPPELGETLYQQFITDARQQVDPVQTGVFGADMQVTLVNNGPATFWLTVN